MTLPRLDGKVGPSNDVLLSLALIPCAMLCGAGSHHPPALVRRRVVYCVRYARTVSGTWVVKYLEDSEKAAMHYQHRSSSRPRSPSH